MKLLWKLLRTHISVTQFTGFFIANLIGLTIVLAGIQFREDLRPLFTQGDSFMKEDYIVASKKVNALRSIAGVSGRFSQSEIEELKSQPFIKEVGSFEAARFRVYGGLQMQGTDLYFQTYMFFEAVPDRFIDIPLKEWEFNEDSREIPIIIPRSYLNLYNFGFAESRAMPKLSEGMIKLLRLDINLRGNGKREDFKGRIEGFSNRLNTILVPSSFMKWANEEFGTKENEEPVRIILEVDNPSDERVAKYLASKNYETEGDKLNSGKMAHFMRIIIGIVLGVGVLICILSFFILLLSIYLLLQKNAQKLRNLMLIGYPNRMISFFYVLFAILLNLIAAGISLGLVAYSRTFYLGFIEELLPGITFSGISSTIVFSIILFVIISLIDIIIIMKKVSDIRK